MINMDNNVKATYKSPMAQVFTFESRVVIMQTSPGGDAGGEIPGQNED